MSRDRPQCLPRNRSATEGLVDILLDSQLADIVILIVGLSAMSHGTLLETFIIAILMAGAFLVSDRAGRRRR